MGHHKDTAMMVVILVLAVIVAVAIYDLLVSALHSMFPTWSENAIRLLVALVLIVIIALIIWFSRKNAGTY